MCGRFAASAKTEDLIDFFEIDEVADPLPGPRYNIAPTDPITAVVERAREDGVHRLLTEVRWGLVPSWAKDRSGASRLINARVETVASKPSFRQAFARRRCLIPADGYYEWYATEGLGTVVKQPYFLHRADGRMLAMAGLYEYWKAPEDRWLTTAVVITAAASDAAGMLHDRMPMVVQPKDWAGWLDPGLRDDATGFLSVPGPDLAFHPVSTAVNRVGNDGPQLLSALG
jgi:putative SOS response-associated peptidase YedK